MLLEIAKLPTAENSAIHLHPDRQRRGGARAHRRRRRTARGRRPPGGIATPFRPATRSRCARSRRARWCCATARPSGAPSRPSSPAATSTPTTWPSRSCTSTTSFRPRERPCRSPERGPYVPRLPARGRPRRHAQLHRRGGRQQLRRPYRRDRSPAATKARTLPPNVDGVVAFPHGEGCGHAFGPDVDQLRRTLGGVLAHPNVSAAVILGLGCEVNQIDHYLGDGAPTSRAPGRPDPAIERRNARHRGRRAPRDRALHRAGRRRTRAPKCPLRKHRAGAELRRLGFLLRHHRQSGAGLLLRPAGRTGRHRRARRDPRDLRRRAPAGEARAESAGGRKTVGLHPKLQAIPESL